VAKTPSTRSGGRRKRTALEYRLRIDAYTPDTLPLWRLAEYLADLAVLLGEREHVHFRRIEKGSAVLVQSIDWESYPKVRSRVHAVKRRQAPQEVLRRADEFNRRLADDHAAATLYDPQGSKVLQFRGRDTHEEPEYAFSQPGELYGTVVVIGGTSDPVPVHLQDGANIHLCEASRALARELAVHIFGVTIAVTGLGRWARSAAGEWKMRSFRIQQFRVLDDRPLAEVVEQLRRVDADWVQRPDPLGELEQLRKRR
jgi:hypothetical protein